MKRWLIILAASVGAIFRLLAYVSNRSLWFDEAALAINIIERPVKALFRSLEFHQAAPIGFLIAEKFIGSILGPRELALRLFPLICGLLTLVVIARAARFYVNPLAVPFAAVLVAVNPSLIYYSSEVKQYSTEALITVLLLWAFAAMKNSSLPGWNAFVFALAGAAAVWFSYPAIFLLLSAAVVFLVFSHADTSRTLRFACIFAVWAVSATTLYFISWRVLAANSVLLDFWRQYFPPQILNLHTLSWLFDALVAAFRDPVAMASLPGMAFLIVGFASLFRRDRVLGRIALGSCLLMVLAGFAHKYPLGNRLLIFAIPVVLLLVAEGAAAICLRLPYGKLIYVAVACALVYQPAVVTARELSADHREDIRPLLEYIAANSKASDGLYVYFEAQPQMRYYSNVLHLHFNWKLGSDCEGDAACYAADVDSLVGARRQWIVMSHVMARGATNDRAILVQELDRKGRRLGEFSSPGARVYLYDMSVQ